MSLALCIIMSREMVRLLVWYELRSMKESLAIIVDVEWRQCTGGSHS